MCDTEKKLHQLHVQEDHRNYLRIEGESFRFNNTLKDQPVARWGILSTIASIYDPLSFLAPYVFTGILERA